MADPRHKEWPQQWAPRTKRCAAFKCECGECKTCRGREHARKYRANGPQKSMGRPHGSRNSQEYRPAGLGVGVVVREGCKFCVRCRQIKPTEEFHQHSSTRDGRCSYCAVCHRAYNAKYKEDHPLVVAGQKIAARKWKAENRGAVCAQSNRRRARKLGIPGSYTKQEWADLCSKFDHRCVRCGKNEKLTADHVIPVSRPGASNFISNIQPLCVSCNCRKHRDSVDYRETPFCGVGQGVLLG